MSALHHAGGAAPALLLLLPWSCPDAEAQSWVQHPPSVVSPDARTGHVLAYDPVTDRTALFGGVDDQGNARGRTWIWNGSSWRTLGVPAPAARSESAMAADRSGLVLFGGMSGTGQVLGDTWILDAGGWRPVIPASSPPPRRGHAMAPTRDGVLLFGGRDPAGNLLQDTWLWDGVRWRSVTGALAPQARSGASMAFDAERGRVVLFGGGTGVLTGDVWEWDGDSWSSVRCRCPGPDALARLAYDPVGERVVAFSNGTWTWDGSAWTDLGLPGPGTRRDHGLAVDPLARLVLFGGGDTQTLAAPDTWLFHPSPIASVIPFGIGCGNATSFPRFTPIVGELPYLGGTFRAELSSLPPGNPVAVVALGLSRTAWGGFGLPLSLQPFGMLGCSAFVSVDDLTVLVGSGGTATWSLQLPVAPSLAGTEVFAQGVVVSPTANPPGLVVSNALALVAGHAPPSVEEGFDSARKLDRERSSGDWSGGLGTFGTIGGSGRHGDFDPLLGQFLGEIGGKKTFLWDSVGLVVPPRDSHAGIPTRVLDGHFEFTRMVVPADVRIRVTGRLPVIFDVSGRLDMRGEIVCDGGDAPGGFNGAPPTPTNTPGQPGAPGGPGGGSGGAGGDRCDGMGVQPRFSGQRGDPILGALSTGGQGSSLFPLDGLTASVVAPPGNFFSFQSAAGGGGGGFVGAGGAGMAVSNSFNVSAFLGPPASGGTAVNLFPIPPGRTSLMHFLVGGSGGGGGGSHPLFSNTFVITWSAGTGGGGGGGAVALRAGHALIVDSQAVVSARGGSGADYTGVATQGTPAPGGGGSGGSIVLQSGGAVLVPGAFDVRGGRGGSITRAFPSGGSVVTRGGDGGHGMIRLEASAAQVSGATPSALLPGARPAANASNVGVLQDTDRTVAFQSKWFTVFPRREYVRYELEAVVNGTRMLFSDDPAVGPLASPPSTSVGILFQAADTDLLRGADPDTRLPWRARVGRFVPGPNLADDGLPAFRFAVVFHRFAGATAQVDRVTVVLR